VLSQTSEYALRAVLYIAREAAERPVKINQVAEALSVPRNYLSKTLHQLARHGVLSSSRGPTGGFQLAVAAEELTLARVVSPFDPFVGGRQCLLGQALCSDEAPCAAHGRWREVSSQVCGFFAETTMADLMHGHSALPGAAG
jgi:Rrf2 family protein